MSPTFSEAVGGGAMLFALAVVSYVAITTKSEVALGALLVVVSGGVQYFLRAKLQPAAPEPDMPVINLLKK